MKKDVIENKSLQIFLQIPILPFHKLILIFYLCKYFKKIAFKKTNNEYQENINGFRNRKNQ